MKIEITLKKNLKHIWIGEKKKCMILHCNEMAIYIFF